VTGHLDQAATLADALDTAERTALRTLGELGPGCDPVRVLAGSTKRGPAFVYVCAHCTEVTVVSVPVGGLRDRAAGDPTSRTRISTFSLDRVLLETGAYIESDGTVRARFAVHLPGHDEPEWDVFADRAAAVGEANAAIRSLRTTARPAG